MKLLLSFFTFTLTLLIYASIAQAAVSQEAHFNDVAAVLLQRKSAALCLNKRDFPLKNMDEMINESVEAIRSRTNYDQTIEVSGVSLTQTSVDFGIVACVTLKITR